MEQAGEAVTKRLFEDDELRAFGVLDGASIPDLLEHLYSSDLEYECLYRGELTPDIAEVAPYLVALEITSAFTHWLIERGWGRHWGVFALSRADLRALRRHFRTLLIVHDSTAKPLYFRYYDPRVLRVYLPTCNAGELSAIFGPVEKYLLEEEQTGAILSFHTSAGALVQQRDEPGD